jgi:hypothetical protein
VDFLSAADSVDYFAAALAAIQAVMPVGTGRGMAALAAATAADIMAAATAADITTAAMAADITTAAMAAADVAVAIRVSAIIAVAIRVSVIAVAHGDPAAWFLSDKRRLGR